MATTTNYGWTTPDDTALVKDGASAIRTLGTSVDTTTKNLNPSTTLGDIEYRSSTSNVNTRVGIGTSGQALTVVAGAPSWAASPTSVLTTTGDSLYASAANTLARLGIGSTGQVLTVAAGLPSWATPVAAPSGATFISRTTFTAAATVTVDTLFSTTYENYLICLRLQHDTTNSVISVQGRYGSTTHTGSNYRSTFFGTDFSANTLQSTRTNAATAWNFATSTITDDNIFNLTFNRSQTSGQLNFTGNMIQRQAGTVLSGGGFIQSNQDWTGLYFFPAAGNITGIITVYGLAKV